MLQETGTQWDLRSCPPPLSTGDRLFIFFMLAVTVVAALKFFQVLRVARTFRRASQPDISRYGTFLKHSARSMLQWVFVPFFVWGFLAAVHLYQLSIGLIAEKHPSATVVLFTLGEILPELEMAILVSFLFFLGRWHVLKRLEKIDSLHV
jgi:hypothetical protein